MALDKAALAERSARLNRVTQAKRDADVEYLISALNDPDFAPTAARHLGGLGATEAAEPLIRALDSPDHKVRSAAIRALERIDARQAASRLRTLAAEDDDENVRSWATTVLIDWRDPEAFRLTVPLLHSSDVWVRAAAARSLGRLGDPGALPHLQTARPKLHRSPMEWRATGPAFRRAVGELRRIAAGKEPRPWFEGKWHERVRTVAYYAAWAVPCAVLWILLGFWWALLPLSLVLLDFGLMAYFTLRNLSFD